MILPDHSGFAPDLTPCQMLRLGVFGGAYFCDGGWDDIPPLWRRAARLSASFDASFNLFGVAAGQSRQVWIDKGWMHEEDPLGWFQWYCRYAKGRRMADDDRQIKRWRNFARHIGMLRYHSQGDPQRAKVHRQALLQWGWDPYADIDMPGLAATEKIKILRIS